MLMTEQAQMESESKRCEYLCPQGQPRSSSIPLLLLVKQILKNAGLQTTACLRNHQMLDKDLNNSNLNLLLRFQRLLFIQLFEEIKSFSSDNGISVEEGDLQGKLSLLKKYLSLLSHHVSDVMPLAISYGNEGPVQYVHACGILQKDVIGHLLPGNLIAINI